MAKYFTLYELCHSDKALANKLENIPTFDAVHNLEELCVVLDRIRADWGSPIIVTSGFRSAKVNELVGGAPNSNHLYGLAVDMKPKNGNTRLFFDFIQQWLLNNNVDWNELINEYDYSWVHLSLKDANGNSKRRVFSI